MTDNKEMKPIVFCNIGWSAYYDGDENDKLIGGGSYVAEHGSGNEHLNYYPIWVSTEGSEEEALMLLGSFETKHNRGNPNQTHIEKIHGCKSLRKENYADDVIVVWCAKNPQGKTCVIGWYKNATVCRFYEIMPMNDEDGAQWERWYNVCCRFEDATLLPIETRSEAQWAVPRHNSKQAVSYGFGQANIWYASEPAAEDFVKRMIHQIDTYSGEDAKGEVL